MPVLSKLVQSSSSRFSLPRVAGVHARTSMPAFPRPLVPGMLHYRPRATLADRDRSWVPTDGQKMQEAVQSWMIYSLSKKSLDMAETVVPWYLNQLPAAYFKEVGEGTRMEHLKSIAALRGIIGDEQQDINFSLRNTEEDDSSVLTILRTACQPGAMHDTLSIVDLKNEQSRMLRSVRSYTAFDETMTLTVFTHGRFSESSLEDAEQHLQGCKSEEERAAVEEYISNCHPFYTKHCSAGRFRLHRELYDLVKGTDNVEVRVVKQHPGEHEVIICTASDRPVMLTSKITALLPRRGINIIRLQLDVIKDPLNAVGEEPGSVCMMRFLVEPAKYSTEKFNSPQWQGDFDDLNTRFWKEFEQDLRRIKWLDQTTLDLALKHCPDLGLERAEILTGMVGMLHGPLSKVNPFTFSRPNMQALIRNKLYTHYFTEIADLLRARFDPNDPLPNDAFNSQCGGLRARLEKLTNEAARILLLKMCDAVELTLRTNIFCPNRYALAFRVAPSLMVAEGQTMPFGAIFVHGGAFDGFHNRFQNIARGGLRLVSPNSPEQYALESSRCYDEVYGLSFAQQLKNKDIPEGGSKAVVLVNLEDVTPSQRHGVMRTSVRGFTDSILDLIVPCADTRQYMVDHLGFDELIYLGPDEQIIPEDIDWIIQQAGRRGYPIPAAFMSSKPLAGINHKEYGVTSEGVAVFLDVALRTNGINPKEEEFSVKVTGGPDGDVAGNLMRIMFREYGNNVRIVGVADGSGCAEDPAGLSHAELMRLFYAELPIGQLDASTLSPQGAIHLADTEEGIMMRNTMYNRVQSDVFVPAGGRPGTVHSGNWQNFLDADTGAPSSPLIVEGANIFISPEARTKLFEEAGVIIVKDSSANKCGVITSSYEICASMLLSQEEFLEIKEELVEDVLARLRELARLEAELLFREYSNYPGALPVVSERISQAINRSKDAVQAALKDMQRGDEVYNELLPLFLYEHLPKKLAEVAADRVNDRIPLDYMRNAFASCLASKLLYREGTHFVETQPTERLASLAIEYYAKEQRVQHLLDTVEKATMPDQEKAEVLRLLQRGGTRSAIDV